MGESNPYRVEFGHYMDFLAIEISICRNIQGEYYFYIYKHFYVKKIDKMNTSKILVSDRPSYPST